MGRGTLTWGLRVKDGVKRRVVHKVERGQKVELGTIKSVGTVRCGLQHHGIKCTVG